MTRQEIIDELRQIAGYSRSKAAVCREAVERGIWKLMHCFFTTPLAVMTPVLTTETANGCRLFAMTGRIAEKAAKAIRCFVGSNS